MATYNQVSYGSKGSDVTELQKLLNNNGYNLSVDGAFGSQTQAAVKDYQQKNNLTVDGIAGANTWGALAKQDSSTKTVDLGTTSVQPSSPTSTGAGSSFQYPEYNPSDAVTQAQKLLQEQLNNKPGEYQSNWQSQINDILQQILNREKFSYDLNGDALYQQYKNQYPTQGKMAMMDTMGQAQAMTGGYGNSYAQSVGQQAYQGYLQQLNDKIPELYQLALSKYQMEGDELKDQYGMMAQQEELDYGRYRDQLGDWQNERDYLTNRYDSERDYDYGKWADGREFDYTRYSDNRAYEYQVGRDKISDEQWQKEFDEAQRQFNKLHGGSSGGSGGGSGGSGGGSSKSTSSTGGGYDNGGYSTTVVKNAQAFVGASGDGKWGANSAAAAKKKGYNSLAEVVAAMQKSVKNGTTSTGTTTSNPKPSTQMKYSDVCAKLDSYIANGASKSKIGDVISQALSAGIITAGEANKLKSVYVPRGYTY